MDRVLPLKLLLLLLLYLIALPPLQSLLSYLYLGTRWTLRWMASQLQPGIKRQEKRKEIIKTKSEKRRR